MLRKGWRRFRPTQKKPAGVFDSTENLLESLLRQTPTAVQAQHQMDTHPHGYHNNKTRLYELIDFNDTFVSLALSLKSDDRVGFIDRLKTKMQQVCKEQHLPMFTDEQYEAITKGLSREVAVYLGAMDQGYRVSMTSRAQDAMGVDMVITDPQTNKSVNIDCKTPSAYHFRLKDLQQQGRLTDQEVRRADERGFVHEVNGQGDDAVAVTILRIDPNELGDIQDFTFDNTSLLARQLQTIFSEV